jgi:hypothetical protein
MRLAKARKLKKPIESVIIVTKIGEATAGSRSRCDKVKGTKVPAKAAAVKLIKTDKSITPPNFTAS